MSTELLIFIIIAALCVIAFFSYMYRQIKKSREIDKTIDYSKMREWKEDD